ncbi:Hypothetical predicted protein [Mytilus galloprovincialis]|uniref:Uncharacterized protein n=1 Tax=Mytilus galloprovincialis TaxID=29158 RepID=A0A8B6H6S5_MYTGA|nr:Hypothetical predicted protein [Mytilus galloprovincialis]
MSYNLTTPDRNQIENFLQIGTRSPVLAKSFVSNNKIVLTLEIKYPFLRKLSASKFKYPDLYYVDIINSQLGFLHLKQSDRLEKRFYTVCKDIAHIYKKNSGGRQKAKLDSKFTKIAIFENDILSSSELTSSLEKFADENVSLADQCRILSKQIKESEEQRKLDSPAANISKPYEIDPILINNGKKFQEAGKTQRYEKIKTLTNKVDKALWFFESYGLKPSSLKLTTVSGEPVKQLDLADKDDETRRSMDLEKMKAILFILDKFKISDQAYHEIVRKTEDLPRLHSIVRLREKTNSTFEIYRTTGNIPGAYVSLKSELENCFKKFETLPSETIKIKISGDGTRVTRISNFIVLSFSIISETAKLSADEQTVLAIVKTSESYENLSSSLHPVFSEINELYHSGSIQINENIYKIQLFFGGDMKFLQICLGIGSSTGEYACVWCKVSKFDRGDISKPWDFYLAPDMKRSISETTVLSRSSKKGYGVKHTPLLTFEPEHCVPDELHLFMRIFDVLLRNVIDDARNKDIMAKVNEEKGDYLEFLVANIRKCGVSFDIWTPKGQTELDWTSLCGADMKKVMKSLPDLLMFVIHNETHDTVVKLWKDFWHIYQYICSNECERRTGEATSTLVKDWITLFLSLFGKRKGYGPLNITRISTV